MDAITIKDIARALNLSTSTISRALRDSHEISPDTKRLVMDYAAQMNYRPNSIALSLKENRSRAIGVVVPEIANYFFSQAINGIEAVAYDRGYHVFIFQSHERREREVLTVRQAVDRKVDGLLLSLSSETDDISHLTALHRQNFPMVLFDRVSADLGTPCIVADDFGGAFAGTEHLIQTGRKRIALITIPPYISISRERLAGYRAALTHYGLTYDENLVRYAGFGQYEVDSLVEELVQQNPRPNAIFTVSDRLTLSCLRALHARNITIPDAVALVGFTNLPVADLLAPSLSTVGQPAEEIGRLAADQLINLIEHGPKAPRTGMIKLPSTLVVRESSAVV